MLLWQLNLQPAGTVRVYWLEIEPSAGGDTALVIQDATHAQLADNVAITGGVVVAADGLTIILRRRRR